MKFVIYTISCCFLLSIVSTSAQNTTNSSQTGIFLSANVESLQKFTEALLNTTPSNCTRLKGHHGIISLDPFGHVYFKVDRIQLLQRLGGRVNISLLDGVGVKVSLTDLTVEVGALWQYRYKLLFIDVGDAGSIIAKLTNLNLEFILTAHNANGRILSKVSNCRSYYSKLDLNFDKKINGFIYAAIIRTANWALDLCELMQDGLNEVAEIPLQFPIFDLLLFDASLTQAPTFQNNSVNLFIKGEFTAINSTEKYPFQPSYLDYKTENRLLNAQVTKATFLSLINSFLTNGSYSYEFTREKFPEHRPLFDASCWSPTCIGFVFWKLKFGYGGYHIDIKVTVARAPKIAFKEEGIYVKFEDIQVYLTLRKRDLTEKLARFHLTWLFLADFSLSPRGKLRWKISNKGFNVEKVESYKGDVPDVSPLVNLALDYLVVPDVNDMGKIGKVVLPESCWDINNSTLDVLNGSVLAGTDVVFG